jgi:3-keto-disaccharide hydrolase/F5/8 type C domain-containing protein
MNSSLLNKIQSIFFLATLLFLTIGHVIVQNGESITNETCSVERDLDVFSKDSVKSEPTLMMIDDDLKTYWKASRLSTNFVIDLGKAERICFIDILWHNNYSESKFRISASTSSNTPFKEVYLGNSNTNSSTLERYDFQDVSARYLNFTFIAIGNSFLGVTELEIYTYKHTSRSSRLPELPILSAYDNFDNKTTTQNKWQIEYSGHGFAGRIHEKGDGGIYRMFPTTSTSKKETHAALVTSAGEYSDFRLSVDSRTDEQLRKNSSPKKWEVAWIFFRYTDTFHYYWFSLKPNGFELGKKDCTSCTDPVDGQIILFTGPLPTLKLGAWSQWAIDMTGNKISISVDGNKIIDFEDSSMSKQLSKGKIAMYTEDAKVGFDNFYISPVNLESVNRH